MAELIKATVFYKVKDYHKDYFKKNPIRYKFSSTITAARERSKRYKWQWPRRLVSAVCNLQGKVE